MRESSGSGMGRLGRELPVLGSDFEAAVDHAIMEVAGRDG